jgi:concanavalin A-like lectin/glucanase superfamily protein/FecR-like protein
MNGSGDSSNELTPLEEMGLLAAALCDGHITSTEARRLEELACQSKEARRFLMRYVQLHGELYWDNAADTRVEASCPIEHMFDTDAPPRSVVPTINRSTEPAVARRFRLRTIVAVAAAAAVILAAVFIAILAPNGDQVVQLGPPPARGVARLGATSEAQWVMAGPDTAIPTGAKLVAGRRLELGRGLAEISFNSGAGMILEGPAVFEPTSENGGFLHSGRLAANVPVGAAGFSVHTPSAMIVDLGTEFGVAVEADGASEVQVFSGKVEISPASLKGDDSSVYQVHDGQTARIGPSAASVDDLVHLASANHRFVRTMPIPRPSLGSVGKLRSLVAKHPRLIHHYPFEGTTRAEKCQDCRGDLHLAEAVMHTGRGGGSLGYTAQGFDATTEAIVPFRAKQSGNTVGVGLQSEDEFLPPDRMTVELLLRFVAVEEMQEEGFVSAAIATRADGSNCGFLVAAADRGNLIHLLDGDADWVESGVKLAPGDWYYLAVTFRTQSDQTVINTYLANLDDERPVLEHLVKNHVAPGVPAASRLGVGKGFDFSTAHAYPWSGSIDEVAVYDDVLDVETLQKHCQALTDSAASF